MKIQLPGIAGGAGLKLTLTNMEGLTADGDCLQQTHRARLQIQWGTTYVGGRAFSEGFRVNVLEVDAGARMSSIPSKHDQCQWSMTEVNAAQESAKRADLRPFYDLRDTGKGKGAFDLAIAWGKESAFSAEVGGDFSAFGVKVGLSFEVEQESNVKLQLSYQLAPGGSYHPYHPSGDLETELCWKTVKRRRTRSR